MIAVIIVTPVLLAASHCRGWRRRRRFFAGLTGTINSYDTTRHGIRLSAR